jgi:hypothetical protein
LKAFTDRWGIIALFRQLKQRASQQTWPLLPILTIIGSEGTGKVRTPEVFPRGWAETQADIAIAYNKLLTDNRLQKIKY